MIRDAIKQPSTIQTLSVRFAERAGWLTFVDRNVIDRFLGRPSRYAVPRIPFFFLLVFPVRSRESLMGDLEEEFWTVVLPQYGPFRAKCWYFAQVGFAIGSYLWLAIKKILGLSVIYKHIER